MKIGVFYNLPPGGAKRVLFEEVKALSKRNEIHLYEYTSTDESFLDIRLYCKKVKRIKFDLEAIPSSPFNRIKRDWNNFVALKNANQKIAYEIDEENLDVLLVHPDKFTQASFVLRFLKTPSLYYCHELLRMVYEDELKFVEKVNFLKKAYEEATRDIRKQIDLSNAQAATKIVVNSKHIKKNVKKAYGVNSDVCYPGVDFKVFKPSSKKKKKVLFVGNWEKINGYDLAKESVDLARKKADFDLKQIIFSKGKSDKELAKEYSESTLTLCTSYNEPFGLPAIESMACETPVLAVNEGGYRETVIDGVTGYLLPRDPKAFAEKIEYLIKNPDVARKMGKAGRKHVKKNFTWEKHVKCIEKQLYEIARKNSR